MSLEISILSTFGSRKRGTKMSSDCENKGQGKYLLQKDTSNIEYSYGKAVNGAFSTAVVKANHCKYVF